MAFDWDGYLAVAKELQSDTDGQAHSNAIEAKQRTAISRAYYSMYHLAVSYARVNLGYNPTRNGPNQAHSDIQTVYRTQLGSVELQEIKQILNRLHKARINCDYKDKDLGNLQSLVSSLILDADKMKRTLTN